MAKKGNRFRGRGRRNKDNEPEQVKKGRRRREQLRELTEGDGSANTTAGQVMAPAR